MKGELCQTNVSGTSRRQRHRQDIERIDGNLALLADHLDVDVPTEVEDTWWMP